MNLLHSTNMHYFTLAFGLSDIGGGEIMLVGVIALLLFGKDLPVVMRTLGKHYSRIKNTLNDAKSEFTREMDSAAAEIEAAKNEVGLNERISFDDDRPAPSTTPELSTNTNAPYNPPTQPPESIDQGPESLDKLSAAPINSGVTSIPATPEPAPVVAAETPVPAAVASSETSAPAVETPAAPVAPATPVSLEDLEKRIAAPKKIPPPLA